MFENIVFDWSGVINDNVDDFVNVVSRMFIANGGRRITKRELRQKWSQPYMKFFNIYFPDWSYAEQRKHYLNSIFKFNGRKIYPGMHKLLHDLKKRGKKLYVITGDLPGTFDCELAEYGLEGIFDKVVLDSHDKTQDLKRLLCSENIKTDQAVFVGDTTHEIDCAKNNGIKSIAVTWGMTTPKRLKDAGADIVVNTVRDLRHTLLGN